MPLRIHVTCPGCGKTLRRKRKGCCPACGEQVSAHVKATYAREERTEKVVAVVGTVLVVVVLALSGSFGLLEGTVMYGLAGAGMFYLARKTFGANRRPEE